ncbi:MAG TPA: hypothetical protein VF752_06275 [Thermoleophilaceae bacterium]
MGSEREKIEAELWRHEVQPWVGEQPILELGAFQRVGGIGDVIAGPFSPLVDALLRRRQPLAKPARLPLTFLLAVTPETVHAFHFAHRGEHAVKIRGEVGVWLRGDIRAEVEEGGLSPLILLEWEGGSAECLGGVNARATARLLASPEEGASRD